MFRSRFAPFISVCDERFTFGVLGHRRLLLFGGIFLCLLPVVENSARDFAIDISNRQTVELQLMFLFALHLYTGLLSEVATQFRRMLLCARETTEWEAQTTDTNSRS